MTAFIIRFDAIAIFLVFALLNPLKGGESLQKPLSNNITPTTLSPDMSTEREIVDLFPVAFKKKNLEILEPYLAESMTYQLLPSTFVAVLAFVVVLNPNRCDQGSEMVSRQRLSGRTTCKLSLIVWILSRSRHHNEVAWVSQRADNLILVEAHQILRTSFVRRCSGKYISPHSVQFTSSSGSPLW